MKRLLLVSALSVLCSSSFGQAFNLTSFSGSVTPGSTSAAFTGGYLQNFDSALPTAGTNLAGLGPAGASAAANVSGRFTFGGLALGEWSYAASNLGNATSKNLIAASGSAGSGGFWNSGGGNSTTNADRALGTLNSGNATNLNLGLSIVNGTGSSTGMATLSFALEQFRLGTHTASDGYKISFAVYNSGETAFTPADLLDESKWSTQIGTQVTSDFYSTVDPYAPTDGVYAPKSGATTAANQDSSSASNRVVVRTQLFIAGAGLSWDAGDELVVRFTDVTTPTGSASGLGLDNIQVVPEPASMAFLGLGVFGLARRRRSK